MAEPVRDTLDNITHCVAVKDNVADENRLDRTRVDTDAGSHITAHACHSLGCQHTRRVSRSQDEHERDERRQRAEEANEKRRLKRDLHCGACVFRLLVCFETVRERKLRRVPGERDDELGGDWLRR